MLKSLYSLCLFSSLLLHHTESFHSVGGWSSSKQKNSNSLHTWTTNINTNNVVSSSSPSRTTKLYMVFDFFKQRSKEGLDQLNTLADAAYKGNLKKGFVDVATYTRETNLAFANGLAKSRDQLLDNLEGLFSGGITSTENILEELEDILLQADLGVASAEDIVEEVRSIQKNSDKKLSKEDLLAILQGKLIESLQTDKASAIQFSQDDFPTVIFVMGANGMGKTTTIGKLAHRLRTEGNQTVLMAACDTFRAGAVDQLQQWADRAEVTMFGPSEQAKSPSAVLYGALDMAINDNYDTLLVDTSGRLSNNDALTAELAKMKRVIQKRYSKEKDVLNTEVPHDTLLVLDAAQGRMALDSAKVWNKEIGLTGLILTKLDGTARGGSVVAISRDLQLPVKLIGVGEGISDLRDFEPERFVDSLLGIGSAGGSSEKNEGAMLANRLEIMRKERDERAKIMKKKTETVPAAAAAAAALGSNGSGDKPSGSPNPNASRKPQRKNKKKKKGKR